LHGDMAENESENATRAELRRLLAAEPALDPDGDGSVELRPMFGTLAALVDGHVFAVALADVIGVKLDPASLEELGGLEGSEPLTMGTRTMRAYRSLPASLTAEERTAWLARARDHVRQSHGA
jgi:TfoX/Sxy family transcriptional regulator of competence genes